MGSNWKFVGVMMLIESGEGSILYGTVDVY